MAANKQQAGYVHRNHRNKKPAHSGPIVANGQDNVHPQTPKGPKTPSKTPKPVQVTQDGNSPSPPPGQAGQQGRRYTDKIIRRSDGRSTSPRSHLAATQRLSGQYRQEADISPVKGNDLYYQGKDRSNSYSPLYTSQQYVDSYIEPQAQMVTQAYIASMSAQQAMYQEQYKVQQPSVPLGYQWMSEQAKVPMSPVSSPANNLQEAQMLDKSALAPSSGPYVYCGCSACWYAILNNYNKYMSYGAPYTYGYLTYGVGPSYAYGPQYGGELGSVDYGYQARPRSGSTPLANYENKLAPINESDADNGTNQQSQQAQIDVEKMGD